MNMNLEQNRLVKKKGTTREIRQPSIAASPQAAAARRKIQIVVVDDHAGVRSGIKGLLDREDDMLVVAEAANGRDAIEIVLRLRPDIILLDVELPVMRGEEVVRRIRKAQQPVKVLAVSSYDDRQYIRGMLDNGAQGYITKEEASELLVEAIRRIASGEDRWLSPRAARYGDAGPLVPTTQTMTRREVEILQLLALDKSEAEIARTTGMTAERLKSYLQVLMVKYGVDASERLVEIAKKAFHSSAND